MSNLQEQMEAILKEKNFAPDARGTMQNRQYGIDIKEIAQEFRDNSSDAKAKNCEFYLIPHTENDPTINKFACLDDGCGMDFEKLTDAIILSKHHAHAEQDDGKFGEGINNGVIGLGDDIVIISKKKDNLAFGLYMDIPAMMEAETFKPTSAGLAESYKPMIPDRIWQKFSKQESGTLIFVKAIHDTHLAPVKNIAKELKTAFEFTNADDSGMNVVIKTSMNERPEPIKPLDVFYRKNPLALEYEAETLLRVNRLPNGKFEVYEILTGTRYRGAHGKQSKDITGTPEQPSIWKFSGEAPKGRGKKPHDDCFHSEYRTRLPESGTWYDMPIRIIKVAEDVYKEEGDEKKTEPNVHKPLASVPNRRRGMWFYRNNRLVKPASHLGLSLDDHSNRMRIEVRFPPGLDAAMGLRTQKVMGNEIPNETIHNALVTLFKQMATKLCQRPKDDTASIATDDIESVAEPTDERRTIPLPIIKKSKSKAKDKTPSPPPSIPEQEEELVFDGEQKVTEENFNGNILVTPAVSVTTSNSSIPVTPKEEVMPPTKPRPAYVVNDIGFDIATHNVILTDTKTGREVARFNCYGIGASIRDHYRILCEKMTYETFLSFIEKEVALHQEYSI